jgi:probable DNA metabolism protein
VEYTYDGTFDGLLCCLWAHVYIEKADEILPAGCADQMSFSARTFIETDAEKAERVACGIEKKISGYALRRAYRAFLSGEPAREMDILHYVFFGFSIGRDVDKMHGHPICRRMDVLNHKVAREAERLRGLLRFGALESAEGRPLLYAHITPDCDILQILMPHFLNRYRQEPFVIHDLNREKAAFAAAGRYEIRPLAKDYAPGYAKSEQAWKDLWRAYYVHAAIPERINEACRNRFMPERYWKNLVEDPNARRP